MNAVWQNSDRTYINEPGADPMSIISRVMVAAPTIGQRRTKPLLHPAPPLPLPCSSSRRSIVAPVDSFMRASAASCPCPRPSRSSLLSPPSSSSLLDPRWRRAVSTAAAAESRRPHRSLQATAAPNRGHPPCRRRLDSLRPSPSLEGRRIRGQYGEREKRRDAAASSCPACRRPVPLPPPPPSGLPQPGGV